MGDLGSIPGLGRSPGEGKVYPLQCSGLENYMDYIVHVVTKTQTRLSNFHFTSLPLKITHTKHHFDITKLYLAGKSQFKYSFSQEPFLKTLD